MNTYQTLHELFAVIERVARFFGNDEMVNRAVRNREKIIIDGIMQHDNVVEGKVIH